MTIHPSPDPWQVTVLDGAYWIADRDRKRFIGIISRPSAASDARLVVSAPAMLKLLKRFVEMPEITDERLIALTLELIAHVEDRT